MELEAAAGDGVTQPPFTGGHPPFLQAPGSRGLFPPSANPNLYKGWLSCTKRGQKVHMCIQVSHSSWPRSAHQHLRAAGQTALKALSAIAPACRELGTASASEDHTLTETHATELESSSCGPAAGRGSSPLLTVTLGSALLSHLPRHCLQRFCFLFSEKMTPARLL